VQCQLDTQQACRYASPGNILEHIAQIGAEQNDDKYNAYGKGGPEPLTKYVFLQYAQY
jgi:hypothetical protein